MKFWSKKENYWGFGGFGPCLGISHPTHPHLGKTSQKKRFFYSFPKLEPPRNGGKFIQQDGRKASANAVINLDKEGYQGFWISIRNNIEISIGKIGSTLIDSVANFTDVLREGPEEPFYFGLTTPSQTSASFGVNCTFFYILRIFFKKKVLCLVCLDCLSKRLVQVTCLDFTLRTHV